MQLSGPKLNYCGDPPPSVSAGLVSSRSEDKSRALLNTCQLVFPVGNPVARKQRPRLQAFTRPLPCLECVPRASCTLRYLAFHQLCRGPWCPPPFDCQTFESRHAWLDAQYTAAGANIRCLWTVLRRDDPWNIPCCLLWNLIVDNLWRNAGGFLSSSRLGLSLIFPCFCCAQSMDRALANLFQKGV